jgi:hypothetical protein
MGVIFHDFTDTHKCTFRDVQRLYEPRRGIALLSLAFYFMMIMTLIVSVGFLLWYDNVMRTIKSYLCSIAITNVTLLHSENEMVKPQVENMQVAAVQ